MQNLPGWILGNDAIVFERLRCSYRRYLQVEKLKDLCLKQREEIKSLKSAILFPDVMNSQLQEIVEKQGSELTQAKQLIPTLQRQVTSLTGQLQCLAQDLAQVILTNKHCIQIMDICLKLMIIIIKFCSKGWISAKTFLEIKVLTFYVRECNEFGIICLLNLLDVWNKIY